MKYTFNFKHIMLILLAALACVLACGCDDGSAARVEETDNSWLVTGPKEDGTFDSELSFVSSDGNSVEVFQLREGNVIGCVQTVTYEDETLASTMYNTYANGSYADSLSSVRIDGCVITLTFSTHYVKAAFSEYDSQKLTDEMLANGWVQQEA